MIILIFSTSPKQQTAANFHRFQSIAELSKAVLSLTDEVKKLKEGK
ncbi:hypothetical protein [Sphingobacterium sp. SYP-B4668]|nr:hypothetical protein [Sphingobacterium sp. SYP-B4668]